MSSKEIKVARMKTKEPEGDAQEKKSGNASGSEDDETISMQVDPAAFDCPVCCEPLKLPLFQCGNGHVICSSCCKKLHKKCPTCTRPISSFRCMMLESIIESNRISCAYARYGCQELVPYSQKQNHKKSCNYAPRFCPVPKCTFRGSVLALYSHLKCTYRFSVAKISCYGLYEEISVEKQQLLHVLRCDGEDNRIYLLVNRHLSGGDNGFSGNALSVVCIGAGDEENGMSRSYKLKVLDDDKAVKLTFEGAVQLKREWKEGQFPKCCLYVPDELSERGNIVVSICIKDPHDGEEEDEVEEDEEDEEE